MILEIPIFVCGIRLITAELKRRKSDDFWEILPDSKGSLKFSENLARGVM